jgi:hypothetical protein
VLLSTVSPPISNGYCLWRFYELARYYREFPHYGGYRQGWTVVRVTPHGKQDRGVNAMADDVKQSQMTQRILLCAPAAFRARGSSAKPSARGQKILMVAPDSWYRRRSRVNPRGVAETLLPSPQDWHGPIDRNEHASISTASSDFAATASAWLVAQRRHAMRGVFFEPIVRTARRSRAPITSSTLYIALQKDGRASRYVRASALVLVAGGAVALCVKYTPFNHSALPAAREVGVLPRAAVKTVVDRPPSNATRTLAPVSVFNAATVATRVAHTNTTDLALPTIEDLPVIVVAPAHLGSADGLNLDITSPQSLWAKAGARYGIDPVLIYAVALVETRATQADGSVSPSPWMVRINGHLHNGTRAQSEHAIELADLMAVPVQDVGIMQVYYPMHRDIEPNPIALLNPIRNIDIGTRLLRKAMRESKDPVLQIGYYHSHDSELARGYGQMVLAVYHQFKGVLGKSSSSMAAIRDRDIYAAPAGG